MSSLYENVKKRILSILTEAIIGQNEFLLKLYEMFLSLEAEKQSGILRDIGVEYSAIYDLGKIDKKDKGKLKVRQKLIKKLKSAIVNKHKIDLDLIKVFQDDIIKYIETKEEVSLYDALSNAQYFVKYIMPDLEDSIKIQVQNRQVDFEKIMSYVYDRKNILNKISIVPTNKRLRNELKDAVSNSDLSNIKELWRSGNRVIYIPENAVEMNSIINGLDCQTSWCTRGTNMFISYTDRNILTVYYDPDTTEEKYRLVSLKFKLNFEEDIDGTCDYFNKNIETNKFEFISDSELLEIKKLLEKEDNLNDLNSKQKEPFEISEIEKLFIEAINTRSTSLAAEIIVLSNLLSDSKYKGNKLILEIVKIAEKESYNANIRSLFKSIIFKSFYIYYNSNINFFIFDESSDDFFFMDELSYFRDTKNEIKEESFDFFKVIVDEVYEEIKEESFKDSSYHLYSFIALDLFFNFTKISLTEQEIKKLIKKCSKDKSFDRFNKLVLFMNRQAQNILLSMFEEDITFLREDPFDLLIYLYKEGKDIWFFRKYVEGLIENQEESEIISEIQKIKEKGAAFDYSYQFHYLEFIADLSRNKNITKETFEKIINIKKDEVDILDLEYTTIRSDYLSFYNQLKENKHFDYDLHYKTALEENNPYLYYATLTDKENTSIEKIEEYFENYLLKSDIAKTYIEDIVKIEIEGQENIIYYLSEKLLINKNIINSISLNKRIDLSEELISLFIYKLNSNEEKDYNIFLKLIEEKILILNNNTYWWETREFIQKSVHFEQNKKKFFDALIKGDFVLDYNLYCFVLERALDFLLENNYYLYVLIENAKTLYNRSDRVLSTIYSRMADDAFREHEVLEAFLEYFFRIVNSEKYKYLSERFIDYLLNLILIETKKTEGRKLIIEKRYLNSLLSSKLKSEIHFKIFYDIIELLNKKGNKLVIEIIELFEKSYQKCDEKSFKEIVNFVLRKESHNYEFYKKFFRKLNMAIKPELKNTIIKIVLEKKLFMHIKNKGFFNNINDLYKLINYDEYNNQHDDTISEYVYNAILLLDWLEYYKEMLEEFIISKDSLHPRVAENVEKVYNKIILAELEDQRELKDPEEEDPEEEDPEEEEEEDSYF